VAVASKAVSQPANEIQKGAVSRTLFIVYEPENNKLEKNFADPS
jgi:hypothetical protein